VGIVRTVMILEQPTALLEAQIVACPTCAARFMFSRTDAPDIDACGFESYRLACRECGTALTGIIDPSDEALLLSASSG